MGQQDRSTGDTVTASARRLMISEGPEHGYIAGIPVDVFDDVARDPSTRELAPEQEAVASDAHGLPEAVARECLQALDVSRAMLGGRVLILEPHAEAVGRLLREGGFQGERVALRLPASAIRLNASESENHGATEQVGMSALITLAELADEEYPPLPVEEDANLVAASAGETAHARNNASPGFDRVVEADWLAAAREQLAQSAAAEGPYQVVVALDLSCVLSPGEWKVALGWLKSLVAPEGFLITGEPDAWVPQRALEIELLPAGLLLEADARCVEMERTWRILRWQHRPNDFGGLPGPVARVRLADLEESAPLRDAMVAAYQEVFGGDEWGEWMYCTACGQSYSRREYEALDPERRCACEAEHSLAPVHTLESVLAELRRDLADDARSRLYICVGEDGAVESFIWGYLTTAREIAEVLLPRQGEDERWRFIRGLCDRMERLGITDPESVPIYHQAYIGSVKQARSPSVPRTFFARMCQFAHDQGVRLVVTATIPSVNAYALLRGLKMEIAYTYPPLPASARMDAQGAEQQGPGVMPYTRLDETGVLLAGPVDGLLALLVNRSERAVARAIAAFLRQQRERADDTRDATGDNDYQ